MNFAQLNHSQKFKNKKGPCGTPQDTTQRSDIVSSTLTTCPLPIKKFSIYDTNWFSIPKLQSLTKSLLWLTESKAFAKFENMISVIDLNSRLKAKSLTVSNQQNSNVFIFSVVRIALLQFTYQTTVHCNFIYSRTTKKGTFAQTAHTQGWYFNAEYRVMLFTRILALELNKSRTYAKYIDIEYIFWILFEIKEERVCCWVIVNVN